MTEPRRRSRLRALGAVLLVLLCALAVLVALLPQLLQPRIERAASAALGSPVAIGWVSVAGALGGVASVEQVSIGEGGALTIARVRVHVDLPALFDRKVLLRQVDVDGLRGTVEQDATGRPALRGLPFPERSGDEADAGRLPVTVQEIVLTDVAIEAIAPRGLRRQPVAVRLDRLLLRQVPTADVGPAYEGELTGSLDGVPLRARARADQTEAGPRIEAEADLTGAPVSSERMVLPPGFESLTATADGKVGYELDPAQKRDRLTVDLALSELKLAGAHRTSLTAKRVAVAGATIDVGAGTADLGKVTITAPRIEAALTEDGLSYPGLVPALVDSGAEPPRAAPAATAPSTWRIAGGEITASDAAFALRRGDQRAQLDVPSFSWRGIASGTSGDGSGELRIAARASTGGTIVVHGKLGIDPARFDVTADVTGLVLPELTALLDLRMQLARGSANGSVQLTGEPAAPRVAATLDVTQLHTRPPEGEDAERILAVDRLETRFTVEPGPGGAIDVASLSLTYPYAMVQREASGIFPVDVLAGEASTGAADETADARPPRPVRIGTVTISNGRLDFVDQTTQPPFWMGVASAEAMVRDVWLTPLSAGQLDFSARQDEMHPVRASVRRTGEVSWQGTATLDAISLATLNPYLSPVLGYEAQTGTLTLDLDATLDRQQLVANGTVSLDGVGLKQTGLDVIQRQTGVPLSVAVSLLKDVGGEIELDIPLKIDTTTGKYELGDFVTQAIGRAVLGALSSPLRWLGMLFGTDGPPQALAIDPIPFRAGSATLDDAGATRVDQVARILASHAELDVILKAQIAPQDASAAGTGNLEDLARRRVDAVRSAFASTRGGAPILASRLIVAPWTPPADGKLDAAPAVYVEVQSR